MAQWQEKNYESAARKITLLVYKKTMSRDIVCEKKSIIHYFTISLDCKNTKSSNCV